MPRAERLALVLALLFLVFAAGVLTITLTDGGAWYRWLLFVVFVMSSVVHFVRLHGLRQARRAVTARD